MGWSPVAPAARRANKTSTSALCCSRPARYGGRDPIPGAYGLSILSKLIPADWYVRRHYKGAPLQPEGSMRPYVIATTTGRTFVRVVAGIESGPMAHRQGQWRTGVQTIAADVRTVTGSPRAGEGARDLTGERDARKFGAPALIEALARTLRSG